MFVFVQTVHEGRAASLQRAKQSVDTVGKGTECGLLLDGWDGCQVVAREPFSQHGCHSSLQPLAIVSM